jgi:hypothetical protein
METQLRFLLGVEESICGDARKITNGRLQSSIEKRERVALIAAIKESFLDLMIWLRNSLI